MESESISQEFQISERKQRKGNKGEERSRGGGHTDLGASAEGGERRRGGAAAALASGRSSSRAAGGDFPQKLMTCKVRLDGQKSEPLPCAWYDLDPHDSENRG